MPDTKSKSPFKTAYGKYPRVTLDFHGQLSRTKQSFTAECDINNIMKKYAKNGLIAHNNALQGEYGNLLGSPDYQNAMNSVIAAEAAFNSLTASIRAKFEHDPSKFLDFAQNPDNHEEMRKMGLLTSAPTQEEPETLLPPGEGSDSDVKPPPTAD
jgi:phage internal scaffolding protein